MILRVYRKTVQREPSTTVFMDYLGIPRSQILSTNGLFASVLTDSYCDGCGERVHPQQFDPSGYLICTNFEGNFRLGCQYLARGLDLNYG